MHFPEFPHQRFLFCRCRMRSRNQCLAVFPRWFWSRWYFFGELCRMRYKLLRQESGAPLYLSNRHFLLFLPVSLCYDLVSRFSLHLFSLVYPVDFPRMVRRNCVIKCVFVSTNPQTIYLITCWKIVWGWMVNYDMWDEPYLFWKLGNGS